jgi:hypothetical protein
MLNKLIILKAILENKNPLLVLLESKILDESFSEWAKNEVELAGLLKEDSDYKGMIGQSLMDLIELFSNQGHSGTSAALVAEIFHKLVQWEPLTECDHSDYLDTSIYTGEPGKLFQCKRCPHMFSEDGGKNWYSVKESEGKS